MRPCTRSRSSTLARGVGAAALNRAPLPRVAARRDDEVVGEVADRPHVEDDDVVRQLLLRESGDAAGLFEGKQGWISLLLGIGTSLSTARGRSIPAIEAAFPDHSGDLARDEPFE